MLQEHTGVMWLDSSILMKTSNLSAIYDQVIHDTNGIALTLTCFHSNYAVIDPTMFHFIPSNIEALKVTLQGGSGSVLLYRTHKIYKHVMKWWVLCALEKNCIAPYENRFCKFEVGGDYLTQFADCHRFDQAALNVLLANLFDFNHRIYLSKNRINEVVRRQKRGSLDLSKCKTKG